MGCFRPSMVAPLTQGSPFHSFILSLGSRNHLVSISWKAPPNPAVQPLAANSRRASLSNPASAFFLANLRVFPLPHRSRWLTQAPSHQETCLAPVTPFPLCESYDLCNPFPSNDPENTERWEPFARCHSVSSWVLLLGIWSTTRHTGVCLPLSELPKKWFLLYTPKRGKFFKSHWHLPLKSPVGFLASANEQQVIQHPSHAEPALPCTCSPRNIDFQSLSS